MANATTNAVKTWAAQVRAPFLILSIALVAIGGAVAHVDGHFDGARFALAMIGVILAHAAVNLFNEYSDYKTGIDAKTHRTPFSGGSGMLQAGHTASRSVFYVAASSLLLALGIGVYLASVAGWFLMVFVVIGGLSAFFYTSHLARWMLGEIFAGLSLGSFVVVGTYFAMAGTVTPAVIWLSIAPGVLTALLLLLNEFPDAEADREGGRRHLVITLGRRRAALLYVFSLAACYLVLLVGVAAGRFPATVLLALLTLPLAAKAATGALKHNASVEKLVPALGANVAVVLGTDFLIALAYVIR